MTYPGEPPAPPPPAPVPAETGRRLKRPFVCGFLALLMAAGVVASAFWPWLDPVVGDSMSGWDIYESTADTGDNPLLITEAFRTGFSPLFTGLTVVIAGGVLAAAALALLVSPKVRQPSQWGIPKRVGTLISLLGFAVLLIPLTNLLSLVLTQPRSHLIQPGAGLIGSVFLAAVGGMAVVIGSTGAPGRKRPSTAH
jgi:hypothetical protein